MSKARLLAFGLALLLCLGLALPALAAEDFIIENETLRFYNGPGGEVVIPEGVRWIGECAFTGREDITGVTFSDEVSSICNAAFQGCTGLTEVTIPSGVAFIGNGAFANCTGLERVVILDGEVQDPYSLHMVNIYEFAFSGCTSLTEVSLLCPVHVEQGAFQGTPWQEEQDRRERTPKLVGLVAGVALGSAVAAVMLKKKKDGFRNQKPFPPSN